MSGTIVTEKTTEAETFMIQTKQMDPYKTFDIGFNNGRFAKVIKFR